MSGSLSVLNTGIGDIQISFNHHDKTERARAIKMLTDMQQRGYAILVKLEDGSYTRALSIDPERGCYIIQAPDEPTSEAPATDINAGPPLKRKRGRPRKSVPIERAHAVGVARSAGG